MTYESLLADLNSVYMYFLGIFSKFLAMLNEYPVIILGLFILVSLPLIYLIFSLFSSIADSTDDFTTDGIRLYKYFRSDKFKKREKEIRQSFHQTKNRFKQKRIEKMILKIDDVPLKIPEKYQHSYKPSPKQANPSSVSAQRSSANIDVEYDED